MQARRAGPSGRAEALYPSFYLVARSKLCGDAPRNRPWQFAARPAARDHGIHHGKRRKTGARRDQRAAFDGRPESPGTKHIFDADEPARKPRPRGHAHSVRPKRHPPLNRKAKAEAGRTFLQISKPRTPGWA